MTYQMYVQEAIEFTELYSDIKHLLISSKYSPDIITIERVAKEITKMLMYRKEDRNEKP